MSKTLRQLALAVGVATLAVGACWWGTWHLVYGDNHGSLVFWAQDAADAKPRRMELRLAPKLPDARHAAYVSLGGLVRTNVADALEHPDRHLGELRHEAWHGHQQARWPYWGVWLVWYGLNPTFRANQEAAARSRQTADWPRLTFARAPP